MKFLRRSRTAIEPRPQTRHRRSQSTSTEGTSHNAEKSKTRRPLGERDVNLLTNSSAQMQARVSDAWTTKQHLTERANARSGGMSLRSSIPVGEPDRQHACIPSSIDLAWPETNKDAHCQPHEASDPPTKPTLHLHCPMPQSHLRPAHTSAQFGERSTMSDETDQLQLALRAQAAVHLRRRSSVSTQSPDDLRGTGALQLQRDQKAPFTGQKNKHMYVSGNAMEQLYAGDWITDLTLKGRSMQSTAKERATTIPSNAWQCRQGGDAAFPPVAGDVLGQYLGKIFGQVLPDPSNHEPLQISRRDFDPAFLKEYIPRDVNRVPQNLAIHLPTPATRAPPAHLPRAISERSESARLSAEIGFGETWQPHSSPQQRSAQDSLHHRPSYSRHDIGPRRAGTGRSGSDLPPLNALNEEVSIFQPNIFDGFWRPNILY